MSVLIFNGRPLSDFGLRVSGAGTYDAPKKTVESVSVPGRNGAILFETGAFENISLKYSGSITQDFERNAASLREWLYSSSGYCRLEDSYHLDEFRLAAFRGDMKFKTFLNRAGTVDLVFDAMPQRFLKSGEDSVSIPGSNVMIMNPTLFKADPIVIIHFRGTDATLSYGNTTITVTDLASDYDIEIDSLNRNAHLTDGTVPVLVNDSLNAHITISGDMKIPEGNVRFSALNCTAEIIPRWWRI